MAIDRLIAAGVVLLMFTVLDIGVAATLHAQPDLSLADVCYTRQVGGKRFPQRRALLCREREEANGKEQTEKRR